MNYVKKRYKVAVIIALIACSINIICGIIGTIVLADLDNFSWYYNYLLYSSDSYLSTIIGLLGYSGLEELLLSLGQDLNSFGRMFYVLTLIINIISIAQFVPAIIFAYLTRNDDKLDAFAFQKKTALHILFIVFVGVSYLNAGSLLDSTYPTSPYYNVAIALDTIDGYVVSLSLFVAFFMALTDIRFNKRIVKSIGNERRYHENFYEKYQKEQEEYTRNNVNNDSYSFTNDEFGFGGNTSKEVHVEEREKPEIKEEETKVDNEKLNEVYELLAKLERQYKNNEISEADYQRMKKTILDNYLDN